MKRFGQGIDTQAHQIFRHIEVSCKHRLQNVLTCTDAIDSTTIDLCLSLFDWAPATKGRAGVKVHTLLDLRGNIAAFIV
jgi:sporulation-control protein spo0M